MDLKYFLKIFLQSENDIPVFRHSGVPAFRCSGIPSFTTCHAKAYWLTRGPDPARYDVTRQNKPRSEDNSQIEKLSKKLKNPPYRYQR